MLRKIRLGMIGGGQGSFIGAIHRMAARLDGKFDLCAGALSSSAEKAKSSGVEIGLDPSRSYASFHEMFRSEALRSDGIEAVAIVTPNHLHFEPAKMALEQGLDVIVDKPLCFSLEEARELRDLVNKTGRRLALTYTYSGYPAILEAREIVKTGKLGELRKVVVQYPQGWLSTKLEDQNQKQASWRMDPSRSGASCCFGDIGTHAIQLAETISGQHVVNVLADLQSYLPGRSLDDDATLLVRFNKGLKGVAVVSQISTGEGNGINISVYGDKGGLKWSHLNPNQLELMWADRPAEMIVMGAEKENLSPQTRSFLRTPSGHPEGYIEAFANIYSAFATSILSKQSQLEYEFPFATVVDGFRGMAIVEAAVRSSKLGSVWTSVEER